MVDKIMITNTGLERTEIFRGLVGSHNYNLITPESDKDFKIFILPTFDDLYKGKMYSTASVGKEFDYDVHDIRKLSDLLWRANINFIEVLYSKENSGYFKEVAKIFGLRDKIATMNLPHLYKTCKGQHLEKMKRLDKSTEGTKHLVEKYGYNTKEALHAFRFLDFITRFAYTDFEDFEWAMTYDEKSREKMLSIKHGEYNKEQFEYLVRLKMNQFEKIDYAYFDKKPNEEIKQELDTIIYKMISESLSIEYAN
jgi:predicted nucleotidyltransferase